MFTDPLYQFYKELYFHEIDVREKLNARVQIPFAIILSLIGGLSFMVPRQGIHDFDGIVITYCTFFVITFFSLLMAGLRLVQSWHNHEYSFLPTTKDCEEYRLTLIDIYAEFENSDELVKTYFEQFVLDEYINSSTINTKINDQRSLFLHFTNRWLIATVALIFVTFIFFVFGDWRGTFDSDPLKVIIVKG